MMESGETGSRLKSTLFRGGPYYSALYVMRGIVDRIRDRMDDGLTAVERKKRLIDPWTISARRYTAADNRTLWNSYDWSNRGDEWTKGLDAEAAARWKQRIIDDLITTNIPRDGVVLEVGPGGGRWTDILRTMAKKLYVVDVSDKALKLCRERFQASSNIDYLLSDGRTLAVPDRAIDAIWSFDVFVHINPQDTRGYFREFSRVLKPGGRAVIHHPGAASAGRSSAWRADTTDEMILEFCRENGLRVVNQSTELVNQGDVLSIIDKVV